MAIPQTPAHVRKLFYRTIEEMERQKELFVNRPGKDFSRHRICTFQDTILTIITKETHCLKRELYEFYKLRSNIRISNRCTIEARLSYFPGFSAVCREAF